MKRYIYVNDVPAVYGAKWMIARLVVVGVLLGVLTTAGFIWLNYGSGSIGSFGAAESMVLENGILKQHLRMMVHRVNTLDVQTGELRHSNDTLRANINDQKYFVKASPVFRGDVHKIAVPAGVIIQTSSMKSINRK